MASQSGVAAWGCWASVVVMSAAGEALPSIGPSAGGNGPVFPGGVGEQTLEPPKLTASRDLPGVLEHAFDDLEHFVAVSICVRGIHVFWPLDGDDFLHQTEAAADFAEGARDVNGSLNFDAMWRAIRGFKPFYGWWIVFASVVAINVSGSFVAYGFPVLFDPIQRELGWSTAAIALGFSLRSEVRSLGAPVAGFLADRFSPRTVMVVGLGVMGVAFLWLSHVETLVAFYAALVLLSMGSSVCNPSITAVAVARWFVRWRSRALAILMVGMALGGLCAPAMGWLVAQYGWRGSLVGLTALAWGVGFPFTATIRDRPQPYALRDDGEVKRHDQKPSEARVERGEFTVAMALRTRAFWHLLGAATLTGLGTTPIMTLLVPALLKEDFPIETAVLAAAAIPIVSIPGRLCFGWWGDYLNKQKLLVACFALQAVGLLVLAGTVSTPVLILFVLLYGTASGGSGPLRTALQADYFGTKAMGTIQGLLQGSTFVDAVLAPVFVGVTVDLLGSYRPAWLALGLCVALAAPVLLTMPKPGTGITPAKASAP